MSTIQPDDPPGEAPSDRRCNVAAETLGAFLERTLDEAVRPDVDAHLLICEACRWVAASTAGLHRARRRPSDGS